MSNFFDTTDPVNAQLPDSTTSDSGSLGGLLTGILGYGAAKVIDAKFPSGNTSPTAAANLKAQQDASAKTIATVTPINWKPYAIGGGIIAGVVVLGFILVRASK